MATPGEGAFRVCAPTFVSLCQVTQGLASMCGNGRGHPHPCRWAHRPTWRGHSLSVGLRVHTCGWCSRAWECLCICIRVWACVCTGVAVVSGARLGARLMQCCPRPHTVLQ